MFQIATLPELLDRARKAFRGNLKGTDAWLWPNNIYVTAKVLAGQTFEIMGFAAYIQKQMFAHTAPDIDSLMLHGEEYGIPLKSAAAAVGQVRLTSTGALTVTVGAVLTRSDGVDFIVVDGGNLPGAGTLDVSVSAAATGQSGNTPAGTQLVATSGIDGLVTAEVLEPGLAYGADLEDIESYRQRVLFRKRYPPHGGAASDYVMWASEVPGVSRVFVERLWNGPGTVRVFLLMDELYADGVPTLADIVRVQKHVQQLQPAGAAVTLMAPAPHPINITISGLKPNTAAVQEAIRAELRDMFRRRSRVAGNDANLDSMPFLAYPTSFSRSWIEQAISNATGEDRNVLLTPAADVPLLITEIATPGTISFVA